MNFSLTQKVKRINFIPMTPLDHHARQLGRKAMEKTLSPKDRALRRLQAGRPKELQPIRLELWQVIYRVFTDLTKAQAVVGEEGLAIADLGCSLVYFTDKIVYRRVPQPTMSEALKLFDHYKTVVKRQEPLFLGIAWSLTSDDSLTTWTTKFNSFPWDAEALNALRLPHL